MSLRPEIEQYYAGNRQEPDRLQRHPLEQFRTREILSRYLPPLPARVLDVGGAAGVYAFWLSDLGFEVHLVDPVAYHLEEAARRANDRQRSGRRIPAVIAPGEAAGLDYPDAAFDLVLMLGPLYHLQEKNARIAALKEAKRVVKRNGLVISAYISRFAALVDGFVRDLVSQPAWCSIMQTDTATGRHTNPTGEAGWFTTAYFHHPFEIEPEMTASGLTCERVLAIESFASNIPDIDSKIGDPSYRRLLLNSLAAVEEDRSFIGISNHILGIGRKP